MTVGLTVVVVVVGGDVVAKECSLYFISIRILVLPILLGIDSMKRGASLRIKVEMNYRQVFNRYLSTNRT